MYDFIYIYIFSLYSFPESIKKPKLPVILSLWLPPHMWGCSIPPPLPTRPQARDLKFCFVTDLHYFMRKSGKVLGSEIYQEGRVNIVGSISPNINFFSGREGCQNSKQLRKKGGYFSPAHIVTVARKGLVSRDDARQFWSRPDEKHDNPGRDANCISRC